MTTVRKAKVAVIDEHDVVRAGLEAFLLHDDATLAVIGSFADPADYLAWLPTNDVDVLVTEIQRNGHAPDMGGLKAACAAGPPVLVYSRLSSAEVILSSLDAGARCYVAKSDGREQLIAALKRVLAGEPCLNPRMVHALEDCATSGRLNLSDREKQVLRGWLRSDNKEEVARALQIAPTTVRTHVQRVRSKYASAGRPAPTKATLLARAIEDGIVGISDLGAANLAGVASTPEIC